MCLTLIPCSRLRHPSTVWWKARSCHRRCRLSSQVRQRRGANDGLNADLTLRHRFLVRWHAHACQPIVKRRTPQGNFIATTTSLFHFRNTHAPVDLEFSHNSDLFGMPPSCSSLSLHNAYIVTNLSESLLSVAFVRHTHTKKSVRIRTIEYHKSNLMADDPCLVHCSAVP